MLPLASENKEEIQDPCYISEEVGGSGTEDNTGDNTISKIHHLRI